MARSRIDKLIDSWDPVLRRAFIEAVFNLRDAAQLDKLTEAVAAGNVEMAIKAIGLDPVSFRPLDRALTAAFEAGGMDTSSALLPVKLNDGFRVNFQFNVRNPEAERWLSDRSSTKISQILEDQRALVQNHLRAGMAAGDNPRTSALDLIGRVGPSGRRENGVIGLTSSQAEWARNYEAALRSDNPADALRYKLRDRRFDGTVNRAMESGEAIPADKITDMVDAYQNRALRQRAETIARTETMAALHEAQSQSMEQAVATGAIRPESVIYIWRATKDKRTRDSHREMDGQEVHMGEKFVTGNGNYLEFPGDPAGDPSETINCRCWRETRVDFLAGIQ